MLWKVGGREFEGLEEPLKGSHIGDGVGLWTEVQAFCLLCLDIYFTRFPNLMTHSFHRVKDFITDYISSVWDTDTVKPIPFSLRSCSFKRIVVLGVTLSRM